MIRYFNCFKKNNKAMSFKADDKKLLKISSNMEKSRKCNR